MKVFLFMLGKNFRNLKGAKIFYLLKIMVRNKGLKEFYLAEHPYLYIGTRKI